VELMVVVGIIAVLSAVAIPLYNRYLRRTQSVEATMNLAQMYDGLMTYWAAEHTSATGAVTHRLFPPSVGYTPATTCCSYADRTCPPDPTQWNTPSWRALSFVLQDPHRFRYSASVIAGTGAAPNDAYELYALGDMNCDGVNGIVVMRATINPALQMTTAGTSAFGELQ
jgi:type II secretory pathway pseudopilin PulG